MFFYLSSFLWPAAQPADEYPTINCERCGTDCTQSFVVTHVEPYETWCNACHGAHHGLEDDDEEGEEVDEEGTEGKE